MDFSDIDHYTRPDRVAAFLSGSADSALQALRWKEFLGLTSGRRLLDVGCGTGEATAALARTVAPGGIAIGIDKSARLLSYARAAHGESAALRWRQAAAEDLPFVDASFDLCRCDRVLSHVDDPGRVLGEIARVLRPRGWLQIGEYDYASLACPGGKPGTAVAAAAIGDLLMDYRRSLRRDDAARILPKRLRAQGWQVIVAETQTESIAGTRACLAALALGHWARQTLAAGSIAPRRLKAARRAWQTLLRHGQASLRLQTLTCLARKS